MDRTIEAARDYDQLGLILLYDGEEQGIAGIAIVRVAEFGDLVILPVQLVYLKPCLPCDVHIITPALSFSYVAARLFRFLRVESEVVTSVQAHIE